jgi:hypothetical protein
MSTLALILAAPFVVIYYCALIPLVVVRWGLRALGRSGIVRHDIWVPIHRLVQGAVRLPVRLLASQHKYSDVWAHRPIKIWFRDDLRGLAKIYHECLRSASSISVTNIEEIQSWLLGCRYVRMPYKEFGHDAWSIARFEQYREGDCKAHALWAWRKLIDLGYDARLVEGVLEPIGDVGRNELWGINNANHLWVLFEHDGVEYILEAAAKKPNTLIRPLRDVSKTYTPYRAVDCNIRFYEFDGYGQAVVEAMKRGNRSEDQ